MYMGIYTFQYSLQKASLLTDIYFLSVHAYKLRPFVSHWYPHGNL